MGVVAIGRHGNFQHWGFAASPADMAEEARTVLANAIVYISGFAGQKPIARKYNEKVAMREYLKALKYLSMREAWKGRLHSDEQFSAEMLKGQKVALRKQAEGEKLNEEEERMLTYKLQKPMGFSDFMRHHQRECLNVLELAGPMLNITIKIRIIFMVGKALIG